MSEINVVADPATVTQEAAAQAAANQAAENKASQIRAEFLKRTHANEERIRDAYSSADKAAASKGFDDLREASQAIGLNWDGLSVWYPSRSSKADADVGPMELCIRQLHASAHPSSSPETQAFYKRLLSLAVNASSETAVDEARAITPAVYKRDFTNTSEGATPEDCRKSLEKRVQDMRDNGQDNEAIARVEDFLAAVDDPQGLAKQAKKLNAMQVAATRWRSSLFLNLFGDDIAKRVSASDSATLGQVWLKVCNAVQSKHAEYMRAAGGKPVVASELQNVLVKEATETLNSVTGKLETITVRSDDERRTAAKNSLYRAVHSCQVYGLLTEEEAGNIRDVIEGMPNMPKDEEHEERQKRARDKAERLAKANAPKETKPAKEPKAAPATSTTGQSLEERLAAAHALIAAVAAGEPLPPAPEVAKPKAAKKGGFKTKKAPADEAPAADPDIETLLAE